MGYITGVGMIVLQSVGKITVFELYLQTELGNFTKKIFKDDIQSQDALVY